MSRIASKACRREPTQKGYHTGAGAAGRESAAPRGIVSYPKSRIDPLAGYGVDSAEDQIPLRESFPRSRSSGRGGSRGSGFKEARSVIDEQTKNRAGK